MKVIGLTGGIGSGKTTVAEILKEQFGAYVIITDEVAKSLMEEGKVSYQLVVNYFGTEILNEDREIDRGRLAAIVFKEKEKLEKLNAFTHPYVEQYVQNKIKEEKDNGTAPFIVVETALLIQAGYEKYCDEIWCVVADEKVREQRLMKNRGYSEEKSKDIIKKQMTEEEFRQYATRVIVNDGEVEGLIEQLNNNVGYIL